MVLTAGYLIKYAAWRTPLSLGKSNACSRKKEKGTKVKDGGLSPRAHMGAQWLILW